MSFYCTGKDSAEIELHLITNLTRLIARLAKRSFVKLRSVSVAAILHIQRRAALLLGMLAVISVFLSVAPLAQTRPNIVFVLADDMGMGDFNPTLMPKTYSLFRRLGAALPMQATQRCVPTRVAVNTGLQPSRLNLHGVEPIYNYDGVPITTPMLAEYLKTARYATHVVGKWHLGLNPAQLPNRRGFDSFVGVVHGNITYYGVPGNGQAYFDGTFGHAESGSHTLMRNDKAFRTTRYSTHLFGQAARTIIRKTPPERQFYLYLAFNAPHLPWSAPWPYIRAVQALAGVSDTELLNLST